MAASTKIYSIASVLAIAFSSLALVAGNSSAQDDNPVQVTTDKDVYAPGETVRINVTVVGPLFASFSSTCQCFFVIKDPLGNVVYDLRYHYYWQQIPTSLSAPPPKSYLFTWDQSDDAGNRFAAQGSYDVWGYVAGYDPMDPPVAGNSKQILIPDLAVMRQGSGSPSGDTTSMEVMPDASGSMYLTVENHGLSMVQVRIYENTADGLVLLLSERVSFGGDKYATKITGTVQVTGGVSYTIEGSPVGQRESYAVIHVVFDGVASGT